LGVVVEGDVITAVNTCFQVNATLASAADDMPSTHNHHLWGYECQGKSGLIHNYQHQKTTAAAVAKVKNIIISRGHQKHEEENGSQK
jgi:hypothetical protein